MKHLLFVVLFAWAAAIPQGWAQLTDGAQISLITCSPSDDEVFTRYGHTSIRVRDNVAIDSLHFQPIDIVFNYGIFDFDEPNFIYRFALGQARYIVAAYDFAHFLADYQSRGSGVYEQILNLTATEKQQLYDALTTNALPENRAYHYSFFFDNCATRPMAMIEQAVAGQVVYNDHTKPPTFRALINHCTRYHPWQTFGCDLVVGATADRLTTPREACFIPEQLRQTFAQAWIITPDGSKRRLVAAEQTLAQPTAPEPTVDPITPMACTLAYALLIAVASLVEWRRRAYWRWIDVLQLFIAGAAGCLLFFLAFVSSHPAIWPNISILWLHPLHWIGAILSAVKKLNRPARCYHLINFAALTVLLPVWYFVPQHLNVAFIPLIAALWLRSGLRLVRKQ